MLYLHFQAAWFGCNICYNIIYCIYISRQPGLGAIYVIILYIVFIFSGGLVWVQPSTGERRTVWGAHRCLQVSFVLFYELIVADMKSTYFLFYFPCSDWYHHFNLVQLKWLLIFNLKYKSKHCQRHSGPKGCVLSPK